jgi:hypothetical protein
MMAENERAIYRARGNTTRVICTFATGRHRRMAALSAASSRRYGEMWGWDLVVSTEDRLASGRPPSWAKVPLLLELLDRYEWAWWIDADAIIVDHQRDVLGEIDRNSGPLWMATHPQRGDAMAVVPNAGVLLARADPAAVGLLTAIWDNIGYVDHNWWENSALLDLLGYSLESPYPLLRPSHWLASVDQLDLSWNSVPGYAESGRPALNHHARADHDDFRARINAMVRDLLDINQLYDDVTVRPVATGGRCRFALPLAFQP